MDHHLYPNTLFHKYLSFHFIASTYLNSSIHQSASLYPTLSHIYPTLYSSLYPTLTHLHLTLYPHSLSSPPDPPSPIYTHPSTPPSLISTPTLYPTLTHLHPSLYPILSHLHPTISHLHIPSLTPSY